MVSLRHLLIHRWCRHFNIYRRPATPTAGDCADPAWASTLECLATDSVLDTATRFDELSFRQASDGVESILASLSNQSSRVWQTSRVDNLLHFPSTQTIPGTRQWSLRGTTPRSLRNKARNPAFSVLPSNAQPRSDQAHLLGNISRSMHFRHKLGVRRNVIDGPAPTTPPKGRVRAVQGARLQRSGDHRDHDQRRTGDCHDPDQRHRWSSPQCKPPHSNAFDARGYWQRAGP